MAIIGRVFKALSRTRDSLSRAFSILTGNQISDETLEEIESRLLASDIGLRTTDALMDVIRKAKPGRVIEEVKKYLIMILPDQPIPSSSTYSPEVVMVVGVNGTGKTTTAAKLTAYHQKKGKRVMLIGADTYRAAAVEQLRIWARRIDAKLVCNEHSQEPASVLFDGMTAARAHQADIVIIDTAGRLHTYKNLMEELVKMYRVLATRFPEYLIHSTIIIDAGLGQNSLIQAREFSNRVSVNGAILTKMDGTAKGGIVFPLYQELKIPTQFLGTGEGLEDLVPFNAEEYVNSLFGE